MTETNPYKVLGVAEDCGEEVLVAVYRHLAKLHHPDKGGSRAEFEKIQNAYDLLRDPRRRGEFDNAERKLREERARRAEQERAGTFAQGEGRYRTAADTAETKKHYMWHADEAQSIWGRFPGSVPRVKTRGRAPKVRESLWWFSLKVAAAVVAGFVAGLMRFRGLADTRERYRSVLDKFDIDLKGVNPENDVLRWAVVGAIAALGVMVLVGSALRRAKRETRAWAIVAGGILAGVAVGQASNSNDSFWTIAIGVAAAAVVAKRAAVNAGR